MQATEIVGHGQEVVRLCGYRDEILNRVKAAAEKIQEGHTEASAAFDLLGEALAGTINGRRGSHYTRRTDRRNEEDFHHLMAKFDPTRALTLTREHVDATLWEYLMEATGYKDLMDTKARVDFDAQLASNEVPVFEEGNVEATVDGLRQNALPTFLEGIARTFQQLDKRFKSHDAFQFHHRVIIPYALENYGGLSSYHIRYGRFDYVQDIQRTFRILDGEDATTTDLVSSVQAALSSRPELPVVVESSYFRVRCFKNGNIHLWFTRKDLLVEVNKLLAEYYGAALPDAVPYQRGPVSTAMVKDLQFYPTPPKVAEWVVDNIRVYRENTKVLEPSAGEGALLRALFDSHISVREVTAVEVDVTRARRIQAAFRGKPMSVLPSNFLAMPADPVYDLVLMNPPFHGTHWMHHVQHAFDFLKAGDTKGQLVAILPASAEVGTSLQHETFHAWLEELKRVGWRWSFSSLPSKSFASTGTNIETVTLSIGPR